MNAAEREIKKVLDAPDLGQRIYTSLENMSKCVLTILETGGTAGWTALIKDQDNKPLFSTKDEQGAFEKAIAPFVGQIQEFFGKPVTQEGGDGTPLSSNPPSDATGIDSMFHKVVDGFRKTDESIRGYSGIIKFEEGYDTGKVDPKPFAALKVVPYVGPIISEIPVPARTIVLIVYTILDAARLMMAIAPTDMPFIRKVMSLVLAVADFLKGDWKRAILSLAGYFGQNYVIMGVFGKTFLNIFAMISPDLQDTMIFGSLDVIKSLIAGVLLFIFQTVALEQMRTPVMDAFAQIKAIVEKNNTVLSEQAFNQHPDYLIPSMTDIQNLQAVVANPSLVCSGQFMQIVDSNLKKSGGSDNYIMTTVLELLRVPLTDDERSRRCGKDWKKTFTERTIIPEQSAAPKQLEEAELPPSTQLTQSTQSTQPIKSDTSNSNKASLQSVDAPLSIDVHVHTDSKEEVAKAAPIAPTPTASTAPSTASAPNPTPNLTPNPAPNLTPNPAPNPTPNPTPNPAPNLTPNPAPNPTPNPAPNPTPNPAP